MANKQVQTPRPSENLEMLAQLASQRTPIQPDAPPIQYPPSSGMLPGVNSPSPAQPAPAGPIGPTSPFDMAGNIQAIMQVPEVKAMLSNLGNIQGQLSTEQARARALATPQGQIVPGTGQGGAPGLAGEMPKMQFSPDMHGNLIHKIGQALLSVAAATRPGQAVQDQIYGPARQEWGAQREANVQALNDLKAQLGVPTEELKAVSGLAQGAGMLAWRGGQLDVARQRADQQGQAIANRYATELQRLSQGAQRLNIEQQNLQLKQWFEKGLLESYNARISAGMDENNARLSAQEDMKAALSQNQWALQHPIWNALGISPTISGAPGASTAPVQPAKPNAQKPSSKSPKKGDPLKIL